MQKTAKDIQNSNKKKTHSHLFWQEFNYYQKDSLTPPLTILHSLSLVPISLLPPDNQNPPTAHGKGEKNGGTIQMAELMFPHDKQA